MSYPSHESTESRFLRQVLKTDSCWTWTGPKNNDGYGSLWVTKRNKYLKAHRYSYEYFKGPIPEGLTLDHLCRNRGCVNPDHLEPATDRENILRGTAPSAINARKTHCKRGHPLSGDNLYINAGSGGRACRTCCRVVWQRRREKMRKNVQQ